MKLEKNERTPYIMKTTKHFNDVSVGGSHFTLPVSRPFLGKIYMGCRQQAIQALRHPLASPLSVKWGH